MPPGHGASANSFFFCGYVSEYRECHTEKVKDSMPGCARNEDKAQVFFSVFTYSIHSVIWIFNSHFIKNKIACTQANPLTAHSEMVVFLSFVCQTGRHRFYYLDPRDEVRTSKNICND